QQPIARLDAVEELAVEKLRLLRQLPRRLRHPALPLAIGGVGLYRRPPRFVHAFEDGAPGVEVARRLDFRKPPALLLPEHAMRQLVPLVLQARQADALATQ